MTVKNHRELIEHLINTGVLKTPRLIDAFMAIDRINFVQPDNRHEAYEDRALSIGSGQTISQPTVVAFMLELLGPKPGDRILDLGCGSGWTTALLAACVGTGGCVEGLELKPELVQFGLNNIKNYHFKQANISQANPRTLGLPEQPAFDKILTSAAANTLPQELVPQFKKKLVIPIQDSIWAINKYPGFVFVPLINPKET